MTLLHFGDERHVGRRLGRIAGMRVALVREHRFPDDEIKLTLPARLPRRVAILRSLHEPNEKLVALWLAARTARELGARHLTLVAPYLAYMRQDRAFAVGEAVSQRHVGALLASLFDRVITVDPHLHRVATLDEVLPGVDAVALSAAPTIGQFLRRAATGAMLVGPDAESAQWVAAAAVAAGLDWATAHKVRRGDRRVSITLPDVSVRGRRVVLVDDMISTGRTLAVAAKALLRAGAARVDVVATHALFAPGSESSLRAAGVREIWTTDSVPHHTNAIMLASLVGAALRRRQDL